MTDPVEMLIDRLVAEPAARAEAHRALERLRGTAEFDELTAAIGAPPADRWTARARPTFLYVMYALLLWAIPMGLIAAVRPDAAAAIARGVNAYLNALPEPLYALFGTGYLGYTVAREWGKGRR